MTQPASEQIERAVLGCILLEPVRVLHLCREAGVSREWFTDYKTAQIWTTIDGMADQADRIDLVTVGARLRASDPALPITDPDDCVDAASTPQFAEHYLDELRGYHLRRAIIRQAHILADEAATGEQEPDSILASAQQRLMALAPGDQRKASPLAVYRQTLEAWRAARSTGAKGIPSRWPRLNRLLGGYVPGKIYVIAARPGAGKSTFLTNEVLHLARAGHAVSVASLEMSEGELRGRMLCESSDISSFRMDSGNGNEGDFLRLENRVQEHAGFPVCIDDRGKTIEQLTAWATSEVIGHKAALVGVDYLQIINSSKRHESRNAEVSAWMNVLRDCAKRLNVPMLLLSQLSRESARDGRRPELQDLRDSGSIEQNAYGVIFIHHEKSVDADGSEAEQSQFIVAKNRGGPTGIVAIAFERERQRFTEERTHEPQENKTEK